MTPPLSLSLFDSYLKKDVVHAPDTSAILNTVKVYSCGPTVYNYQSIGNMRAVWLADTFVRVARTAGWKVEWTLNITDVGHLVSDADTGEDKIEKAARASGQTVEYLVNYYTADYKAQCESLKFKIPQGFYNPKASDYIEEQMILAWQLVNGKLAYVRDDGIYFDYVEFTNNFTNATNALKQILERDHKNQGNRSFTDRHITSDAKHPFDFAIWKFVQPDALQQWKFADYTTVTSIMSAEYSQELHKPGCPGWHSECVCMIIGTLAGLRTSEKRDILTADYYTQFTSLPFCIDVHFGGEDHIDIHHKNEILQSSALGIEISKNWVHNKFVMVDGQKMSKSIGNVYQVVGNSSVTGFETISGKGFDPLAYRLMLMEHNYTQELNFTWDKLTQSKSRLDSMRKLSGMISAFVATQLTSKTIEFELTKSSLLSLLTNNLNTSKFIEEYTKKMTSLVDQIQTQSHIDFDLYSELAAWDSEFLELDLFIQVDSDIQKLVTDRIALKHSKNFDSADRIRTQLLTSGYAVDDYTFGSGVRKLAQIVRAN